MQLTDKLHNLNVRIICVTDDELRKQLQAEYDELYNLIQTNKRKEELEIYFSKFQPCTLYDLLLKSNINIELLYKTFRLRPLTTLYDKRTLIPFLRAFDAKLIVKDMDSITVDTIGNGSNIFEVYVYCLSKYAIDLQPCYKIII